jgi:hypothetical protein
MQKNRVSMLVGGASPVMQITDEHTGDPKDLFMLRRIEDLAEAHEQEASASSGE